MVPTKDYGTGRIYIEAGIADRIGTPATTYPVKRMTALPTLLLCLASGIRHYTPAQYGRRKESHQDWLQSLHTRICGDDTSDGREKSTTCLCNDKDEACGVLATITRLWVFTRTKS